VSQDGREYYAVSKDFNLKEAWNRFNKRDHGLVITLTKRKVEEFWIRKTCSNRYGDSLLQKKQNRYCKEQLEIGTKADVNMDLTGKLSISFL
jgi:hypothetical protein